MRVRDVMTKDPVTVEPSTRIFHTQKLMREHKVRKLPVVKNGKLVGMMTHELFMEVYLSKATGFSLQELFYLLNEMKVNEVMHKSPVTVSPDMPFEDAMNLGQQKGNTGFPVLENGKLVGIITGGDIIRFLTKFLGIGEEGVRITIKGLGARLGELNEIIPTSDQTQSARREGLITLGLLTLGWAWFLVFMLGIFR